MLPFYDKDVNKPEMSIAAAKLPLPRRDVRKKSYRAAAAPRWFIKKSYRDGFRKNFSNFTATNVLDEKYWF